MNVYFFGREKKGETLCDNDFMSHEKVLICLFRALHLAATISFHFTLFSFSFSNYSSFWLRQTSSVVWSHQSKKKHTHTRTNSTPNSKRCFCSFMLNARIKIVNVRTQCPMCHTSHPNRCTPHTLDTINGTAYLMEFRMQRHIKNSSDNNIPGW